MPELPPTDEELEAILELAIDDMVARGKAERFTNKDGKPSVRLRKGPIVFDEKIRPFRLARKPNEKAGS